MAERPNSRDNGAALRVLPASATTWRLNSGEYRAGLPAIVICAPSGELSTKPGQLQSGDVSAASPKSTHTITVRPSI